MTLQEKKKIFHDWAYGLFIHYGVYSVYGNGEWKMFLERLDPKEYFEKALPHFHPTYEMGHYWAELAKRFQMEENRISVKLYRARKKLKKVFEKEGIKL